MLHSHYTMFNFGGIYDRAKVAAAEQQAATTATTTMLSNMRMSTQHGFMEVQSSLYGNRMVVKVGGKCRVYQKKKVERMLGSIISH